MDESDNKNKPGTEPVDSAAETPRAAPPAPPRLSDIPRMDVPEQLRQAGVNKRQSSQQGGPTPPPLPLAAAPAPPPLPPVATRPPPPRQNLTPASGLATSPAATSRAANPFAGGTEGNAALAIPPPAPVAQPAEPAVPAREPADADARRAARRRPAGPPRERLAANDDAPSIGGLIYALNQRPSNRPFIYAAAASGFWLVVAVAFAFAFMPEPMTLDRGIAGLLANPWLPTLVATIVLPIALFWFMGVLVWRSEELHMRSTAMTEVAVRLAEPDRMAEQSVASLGQAVRRQVSFMNDAVSRALGRAGELEALVHNEVSALEHSYEENERKIRALINELAGERHALVNTGVRFEESLLSLSREVPSLIEKLSDQQLKLAKIIEGAGENLTNLENALATQSGRLENSLGDRTTHLQTVLHDYTNSLHHVLGAYTEGLDGALTSRTDEMKLMLEDQRGAIESDMSALQTSIGNMQAAVSNKVGALETNVERGIQAIESTADRTAQRIVETLTERTEMMQTVFDEYTLALDTTLANRAEAIDLQLVERTKALDDAFSERLRLFDEAVLRSTMAIDEAVGNNARTLTAAMESHAREMGISIADQAAQLDATLAQGLNSVRMTSENISRQSIKAIEGLAGQADLLRNVSENLLSQINTVTNRFESQGQAIMRSANALESTNHKISQSLQGRTEELNDTLNRMSGKAEELGRMVDGYSNALEGSLTQAEQRAKLIAQEIGREAEARSKTALEDLRRVKVEATRETDKALDDLRREFSTVSREVTARLGSLTNHFANATGAVREQAAEAARGLEMEQARLKEQLDRLPSATHETAASMRKALSDQLRALDHLSSLATRAGQPDPAGRQPSALPSPSSLGASGRAYGGTPSPLDRAGSERQSLSTLSSSLARGAGETPPQQQPLPPARTLPSVSDNAGPFRAPAAAAPAPSQQHSGSDAWSLGDLLARASSDGEPTPEPPPPAPEPAEEAQGGLDIAAISRALDPGTATTIWRRFQAGQRGFMVRSIYAPESRRLFDTVARRYRADDGFRRMVNRFLDEFKNELNEADYRDPTGRSSESLVAHDTGRVYLVLAHASGRLV